MENTEEVTNSREDDIAAAFDQVEGADDTQESVHTGNAATTETEKPATSDAKLVIGKNTETGAAEQAKPDAKPASITDTPPVTTQKAAGRAPVSWKPEAREKWAALPPEAQAEVVRREREIQVALQESAQARNFTEQFNQVIQPYQHYIAMEGNDPMKAFGDYLRTGAILRGGTATEKANALAQVIRQFDVDVNILDTALANMLNGRPLPVDQGRSQAEYRDPRLDALLAQIEQRNVAEQQSMVGELSEALAEFESDPANEFFHDLRVDMGELLAFAANRGQVMNLREAYDKAAKLNPEISKIIEQRAAAKAAEVSKAAALQRRRAASSVTNATPSQTGNGNQGNGSIRSDIEDAISRLTN